MNVLLDLDGTLTDPKVGFIASVRFALESLGHRAPPDERIASRIGPPLQQTLAALLGPSRNHDLDAVVDLFRERYSAGGLFECEIYEGVPEALGRLRSVGHRLFLATSKPEVYATRILVHFGLDGFFSGIHGSELDGTRSDKRRLISHILDRESLTPESAVMVGDRAQDVAGALANALSVIGALWGYGSRAELAAAGATLFAESPAQLAGRLESSCFLPESSLPPFGRRS